MCGVARAFFTVLTNDLVSCRRMRDAAHTARGALMGDLTDIMMTTREEERVMASIARLDAQLHSTAANRYAKGVIKRCYAHARLTVCRRCCRRCFINETCLRQGNIPEFSPQCCVRTSAALGGVVVGIFCDPRKRLTKSNESDECSCNCNARHRAANSCSITSGTQFVFDMVASPTRSPHPVILSFFYCTLIHPLQPSLKSRERKPK